MKKMFLGLGVSMFLLFILSFHSLAGDSSGNGSPQLNQPDPASNVYQYQFQQSNPLNESGSGPSSETPPGARNGALDGAGPFLNVTGATPFTVSGTVVSCLPGDGLELVVGEDENIFIFGIGPTWFWEAMEMEIDRPAVGDVIQVTGFAVDYSGTLRNIAVTIVIDDNEVLLRDDQGYPLWRGGRALRIGQANQSTP
jgi:hypothetical protein